MQLQENDAFEFIQKPVGEKTRIVYTGSISEGQDDSIIEFLDAVRPYSDIEVLFATPSKRTYLKNISTGFLPKEKCLALQKTADILFLPLSLGSRFQDEMKTAFPTKTLEYLAVGKPILAMAPKGSFLEDLIERNRVGIVVSEGTKEKIIEAINLLRDERKRLEFSENSIKVVRLFDARNISEQFRSLVLNVIRKKSRRK